MKQPKDMSNSEIDTELAERMGWIKSHDGMVGEYQYPTENGVRVIYGWRPTSSLDQCHEIEEEKIVDKIQKRKYSQRIYLFTHDCNDNYEYKFIHATARQKSEALLMTLREVEG